jgi:cytochrome c553
MFNRKAQPVAGESRESPYPFYPNHLMVEADVALLVLAAVVVISYLWQVPLEQMADPGDTTYVPRPEWYFLFLYQMQKYFAGPLIVIGTFIIPLLVFSWLILLPFVDRSESTRITKRPGIAIAGILGVACIVGLTGLAVIDDAAHAELKMDLPPITDAQIAQGKDVFDRYCLLCHQIDGKGGFIAPDLTQIGARRNRASIEQIIIDPKVVSQTTVMTEIPLSDDERHAVSAYLSTKK